MSTPAGWYPNPAPGGVGERFWDGTTWTEEHREAPARAAAAPAQAAKDPDAIWQVVGKPVKGFGGGRFKLTAQYLYFEKGSLRTDSQQVPIAQVLDVDINQSMTQKARQVATIKVHIQRPQRVELVMMEDVPDFREGQRLINETAHGARAALAKQANTRHFEGGSPMGGPVAPAAAAAPEPAVAAVDPIAQLKQLGELRDAGILSEEEFAAKKAEILARL